MKKPAVLSSKSLLLASGIVFASLAPVTGIHAEPSPGIDISIDASGISVNPGADCHSMIVRIMNSGGDLIVDEQLAQCAATNWLLSSDDEDGTYRIEVLVIDADGSSIRQSLSADVVDNQIIIPADKKKSINFDTVKNLTTDSLWDSLGNTVLAGAAGFFEFIMPSAQADTFTFVKIQGGFPALEYDDTDLGAQSEWSLDGFDLHPVDSTFFVLTDLTTGNDAFQFTPGANGKNTFIAASNGDISFADGAVFFDRGADFVGIGTTIPEKNLQINDLNPTIRLTEEDSFPLAFADIIFNDGDLTINPHGDLIVNGLINAVFDGANAAGDGLTKLVDLSANNTSPGKSSDAGFSLFNNMQGTRWNFRTFAPAEGYVATKEGTGGPEVIVRNTTDNFMNVSVEYGNGASVTAMGQFVNASSRAYKENIQAITSSEALEALKSIKPVKYSYKRDKTKDLNLGFIAEDVPELVSTPGRKNMDPMQVVAMLTKVVQEQQNALEQQRKIIAVLQQETLEIKQEVRSQHIVSSAVSFE